MTAYCPLWWATSKATSTCKMNSRFFSATTALCSLFNTGGVAGKHFARDLGTTRGPVVYSQWGRALQP